MGKEKSPSTGTVSSGPPPVGLVTRWRWEEQARNARILEILGAMTRYLRANMTVPEDWIRELNELLVEHASPKHKPPG